jgi:hypothetical protein
LGRNIHGQQVLSELLFLPDPSLVKVMHLLNKHLLSCLLLAAAGSLLTFECHAVESFDDPQPRKASEILPADLITGKHFRVHDSVTWNDGLHEFTVETDFGSFDVWGEPMLRVRLAEVDAWYTLENTSSASAGVKAVGKSVGRSIGSLAKAFAHPLKTVKGVPTGISRMFMKAEHTAEKVSEYAGKDDGENSGEVDTGDNPIAKLSKKMLGVNKAYRRLAKEYGVNPYTTNEALQEELLRVAKVDAVASRATILLPGLGLGLKIVDKVSRAVYEESWLEIVARNEETLEDMNASPDQIKALFSNDSINLTLLTLMLETLKQLEGVEGSLNVIDQMILLETDAEAVFFSECLLMADWYNDNEAALTEWVPGTLVPVALTANSKLIVFSAADFAYWTPDQKAIVLELDEMYRGYAQEHEAWIADQTSPRFVEGLGELGWSVRSGMRSTVLPEIPWGLSDD